MKYTTFDIDHAGNLVITLTPEGREWLTENYSKDENDENIFIELNEYQLCNGFNLVNPEDIGALTSSLLIADGWINEETTPAQAQHINVWYYNYYVIHSYLHDLQNQGYVIWNKA